MLKFNEMTSKHPFFMFMQRCTSCNDKFVATGYRYTSLFIYLFFFFFQCSWFYMVHKMCMAFASCIGSHGGNSIHLEQDKHSR